MKNYLVVLAILLVFGGFALQKARFRSYEQSRVLVVTTTAHIADIVANLAENLPDGTLHVEPLMGSGVDPHLYRPTRSDVAKLRRADIVFYNGLRLEGKMEALLEALSAEKPVIAIAERISDVELLHDPESSYDPHIWMDVSIWAKAADVVKDTLIATDPQNAALYEQNAAHYRQELRELDSTIKIAIRSIPEKARVMVTAHDAFGYFGRAYGIEVVGIQGLSTESEAGLQRIESLVELLVEHSVPAIFPETSVSARNISAVREGVQAKGHDIILGNALFSDSMGISGTAEATYLGMMRYNVQEIVSALGGEHVDFDSGVKD